MASHSSPKPSAPWRTAYLTIYNLFFACLWLSVLIRSIKYLPDGRHAVFSSVEPFTRWVQTATLIEVAHSAVRLIPSPLGTTFTQVATRVIQVWLIWYTFPDSTASSLAFPALVIAWAIADTIRYLYLALNLHGKAPSWLVWLRYDVRSSIRMLPWPRY
jgi:very-long-chain (3R)-3-hydroxyacyl-CoA dehydratase